MKVIYIYVTVCDVCDHLISYSFKRDVIIELLSVTMLYSNVETSDLTQNQSSDYDTHYDSSGASDSITLSQNTEETHTMVSEITETALVPLFQTTEMAKVDNIDNG